MACKKYKKMIPLYNDGLLDGHKEGELAAHLGICRGCKAELAGYAAMQADLRNLPQVLPDKYFRQSWLSKLIMYRNTKRTGFFEGLRVPSALGAAAVMLIFVFAIGSLGHLDIDMLRRRDMIAEYDRVVQQGETMLPLTGGGAEPEMRAFAIDETDFMFDAPADSDMEMRQAIIAPAPVPVIESNFDFEQDITFWGGIAYSGKTGSLSILTEDFEGFVSHTDSIIQAWNLHVESTSLFYNHVGLREKNLTLRVLYEIFDAVMEDVSAPGNVRNRSVSDFGSGFREGSYSTIWLHVSEASPDEYDIAGLGLQAGLTWPPGRICEANARGLLTRMADAFIGSIGNVINFSESLLVFLASAVIPLALIIVTLLLGRFTYRKLTRRNKSRR